jgi:hypothetical protein
MRHPRNRLERRAIATKRRRFRRKEIFRKAGRKARATAAQ